MHRIVFVTLLAACGSSHSDGTAGSSCKTNNDCKMGLSCYVDPFPGGDCSSDCSSAPCADGQTCSQAAGASLCLQNCAAASDCRSGYQCFGGVCTLPCMTDADCGRGYVCTSGQCMPAPGAPLGAACAMDADCSSQFCLKNKCAQSCNRDAACDTMSTCVPNLDANNKITDACTARRGKGAPGAACMDDSGCDRGICLIGLCAELCVSSGDCHGSAMTCAGMQLPIDAVNDPTMLPKLTVCLPQTGAVSFTPTDQWLPVPAHAHAMEIYVFIPTFTFTAAVGVGQLLDPTGKYVYVSSGDPYTQPVRFFPAEASAVMQVPDSAAVPLVAGAWNFDYGSNPTVAATTLKVFYKLANAPLTSGHLPLNFYITDLSAACTSFTAATADATLSADVSDMRNIFSQAGITISAVTYHDVSGPNTIKVQTMAAGAPIADLDNMLRTATANQGTTVGLDVVIVRQIQDQNGGASNILGIAGGIPTSPELGTGHSGAVVSVENICSGTGFSPTASHELGHTLGLYHNIEQDGHHDPLSDTMADGQNNLMYWIENMGRHLTVQQGNVVRGDMKVVQ